MSYRHSLTLLLGAIACFVLTSCGTPMAYYTVKDSQDRPRYVKSALLNNQQPPTSGVTTNLNIDAVGSTGWRLDALAVSPGADYLCLGKLDINSPLDRTNGVLEIRTDGGTRVLKSFDDRDLKALIENNTRNSVFGNADFFAFHPFALGFESDHILIVHIQPQIISELGPVNWELKLNLRNMKVVPNSVQSFPRSPRRLVPVTTSPFELSVINGKLHADGQLISGLPSDLANRLHGYTIFGR